MKLLITGKNGYIANRLYKSFCNREHYDAKKISIRNGVKELNLTNIETIIHTAAIVHTKETSESIVDYKNVNFELTKELAIHAKYQGVKHFIFISSMAVFGNVVGEINEFSSTNPESYYGKSKLAAEQYLQKLEDEFFKVAIIRPPMVYGPDCPGNFFLLSKMSKRVLLFPKVSNKRSMIFIGNLVALVEQIVLDKETGLFHPQDPQLICTSEMVKELAKAQKKKLYFTLTGAFLLKLLAGRTKLYRKVFSDLFYSQTFSSYKNNEYQKYTVEQGIQISELESVE